VNSLQEGTVLQLAVIAVQRQQSAPETIDVYTGEKECPSASESFWIRKRTSCVCELNLSKAQT